jgi:hypothetical protein
MPIKSRIQAALPTKLTPQNKQLILLYAVAINLVDEVRAGRDPMEPRMAMLAYYRERTTLYKLAYNRVCNAAKRDLSCEGFAALDAMFSGFISPQLRVLPLMGRARVLHWRAQKGEVSSIPIKRRLVELAVATHFTVAQRTMEDFWEAFDNYLALAEDVVICYHEPMQRNLWKADVERELEIALWAMKKAAESSQSMPEYIWRQGHAPFCTVLEYLLRMIDLDGNENMVYQTIGIRQAVKERLNILGADVSHRTAFTFHTSCESVSRRHLQKEDDVTRVDVRG